MYAKTFDYWNHTCPGLQGGPKWYVCLHWNYTVRCGGSSYFWNVSPSNYFAVQMIRKWNRLQPRSPKLLRLEGLCFSDSHCSELCKSSTGWVYKARLSDCSVLSRALTGSAELACNSWLQLHFQLKWETILEKSSRPVLNDVANSASEQTASK